MASRAPVLGQSPLDTQSEYKITDLALARIATFADVSQYQHQLASRWGGPDTSVMMQMGDGGTTYSGGAYQPVTKTYVLGIQVPPGVEWVNIRALVSGRSKVTITTDYDSTGTILSWDVSSGRSLTQAKWIETIGPSASGAGASSGRAVEVRASPLAKWVSSTFTFVVQRTDVDDYVSDDSTPGQIHALCFGFVFQTVDSTTTISV